jgi:hypothetical protein
LGRCDDGDEVFEDEEDLLDEEDCEVGRDEDFKD